jgi:hypothetical protein
MRSIFFLAYCRGLHTIDLFIQPNGLLTLTCPPRYYCHHSHCTSVLQVCHDVSRHHEYRPLLGYELSHDLRP